MATTQPPSRRCRHRLQASGHYPAPLSSRAQNTCLVVIPLVTAESTLPMCQADDIRRSFANMSGQAPRDDDAAHQPRGHGDGRGRPLRTAPRRMVRHLAWIAFAPAVRTPCTGPRHDDLRWAGINASAHLPSARACCATCTGSSLSCVLMQSRSAGWPGIRVALDRPRVALRMKALRSVLAAAWCPRDRPPAVGLRRGRGRPIAGAPGSLPTASCALPLPCFRRLRETA